MTPLERKKIEVELLRVNAAKEEMELKILENQEQIARLQEHIKIQEAKEQELRTKLAN
jgi:hypothetical protein